MVKQYAVDRRVRLINKVVTGLTRTGMIDKRTFMLTTVGRKSGEDRSTPVALAITDSDRYLVSPYGEVGWVHNIRAASQGRLTRRGTMAEIRLTEVDANEAGPVLQQYWAENKITRPYFATTDGNDAAGFLAEADNHPVFRIER